MTFQASARLSFSAIYTEALDIESVKSTLAETLSKTWAEGTGNDQCNACFSDIRTLAASGTENIDLAGVLVDVFGQALTFTKIKSILVHAALANNAANAVRVARPASNGFPFFVAAGDAIDLPPDGKFYAEFPKAGIAVVAGTGDLITITNTAGTNSVDYLIVLFGTR